MSNSKLRIKMYSKVSWLFFIPILWSVHPTLQILICRLYCRDPRPYSFRSRLHLRTICINSYTDNLLLLWRILNGRGLPNCMTELPSLKCLSSSLHSRDSHPFANVLRPSPSGCPSASPTLTCALQE